MDLDDLDELPPLFGGGSASPAETDAESTETSQTPEVRPETPSTTPPAPDGDDPNEAQTVRGDYRGEGVGDNTSAHVHARETGSEQPTTPAKRKQGDRSNDASSSGSKADRPEIDWDTIEDEYRAGTRSITAIAADHGCSRQAICDRAKRYGWTRNLTAKVRAQAEHELVFGGNASEDARDSSSGTADPHASDAEAIQRAASAQVEVVRQHRKDLAQLRELHGKLVAKAEKMLARTRGNKGSFVASLSDLQTAVQTVESLARTVARSIPLERQAFNIDGGAAGNATSDAVEQRVRRYQDRKKADADDPQAVERAQKLIREHNDQRRGARAPDSPESRVARKAG